MAKTLMKNKELSCRRETVRCYVSLNISLSHSRSVKVMRNHTIEYFIVTRPMSVSHTISDIFSVK